MAGNRNGTKMNMLEELPVDIMVKVLVFMDINTKVKLAGCNSTLQNRVYRDCSLVWQSIRFPWSRSSRILTDENLSRLLTRVNARKVTKSLDLCYCGSIEGRGLLPLRNSRVLETVIMRSTWADLDDPRSFLRILRASVPFELLNVRICLYHKNDKSETTLDFLRHLREAKTQQAGAERRLCSSCRLPLVDESRQAIPDLHSLPMMCWVDCKRDFCHRPSCPMQVWECDACYNTYCIDCQEMRHCHTCGSTPCKDCDGNYLSCSMFNNIYCYAWHTALLRGCSLCEKSLCQNCGIASDLPKCGRYEEDCKFCNDCVTDGRCASCYNRVCVDCGEFDTCGVCKALLCHGSNCEDILQRCPECKKKFCDFCEQVEACRLCDFQACEFHDMFVDCEHRNTRHCRQCEEKRRCEEKRPAKRKRTP